MAAPVLMRDDAAGFVVWGAVWVMPRARAMPERRTVVRFPPGRV